MPGPSPLSCTCQSTLPGTWQWNFFQEPIESSQKLPWQGFQKKTTKDKKGEKEGEKGSQKGGGRGKSKA